MIRISGVLLAIGLSLAVYGQIGLLPYDSVVDLPATRMHRITLDAWADYNSSSVYNELPWAIYQGGFISRDLRERSREALQSRNSAGYDVGARFSWVGGDSLFGRARMRPMVSVAYRNVLGVSFTRDVYDLAFFGNAHFEDLTADLAPSAHAQMTWQSFGFGIQDAANRSFFRVDVLRGRAFNASDIRQALFYTAPDGRSLQLVSDAAYWRTDTAGSGEQHTNGMGVSLSGRLNVSRSIANRNAEISLQIEDAGFMHWDPNSLQINRQEATEFEGLSVENVFDLGELLVGEEQLLDTLGLRYERGSYTTLMPMRAALSMELALDRHWKAGVQVDHRYLPGYRPQVMLSASRRLGNRVLLGASATYGGFGVLRFGLASRLRIGELMLLELGTTHAPGFFMGNTRGAGAYASLSFGF